MRGDLLLDLDTRFHEDVSNELEGGAKTAGDVDLAG